MKTVLLAIAFMAALSATAAAEDCRIYPPGHARFACASAKHPGLIARRERCRQEAQQAGANSTRGTHGVAYRDYVMHCMRLR